jgi:hypothetical protein
MKSTTPHTIQNYQIRNPDQSQKNQHPFISQKTKPPNDHFNNPSNNEANEIILQAIIMYKISMLWYIGEIVPDRSEKNKLDS